jgi:hypothetical protein
VLLVHAVFVAFADAQHAIKAKTAFAAAVDEGAHPFFGVVIVHLGVFGCQSRVGAHGVVRRAGLGHQLVALGALQHIDLPGLGVGAAGGAGGNAQHLLQDAAVDGFGQVSAG